MAIGEPFCAICPCNLAQLLLARELLWALYLFQKNYFDRRKLDRAATCKIAIGK